MAKVNQRRQNGNARDKLRARVRAEQRPCHLCGHRIDYAAHYLSPTAYVLDELVPVSRGGSPFDYSNVDAAHRCCNQWRGNKPVNQGVKAMCRRRYEREIMRRKPAEPKERKPSVTYQTSRKWLPGG